jgi:hypothetical protein
MRRVATVVLSELAFTAALVGSASGKIVVELDPRAGAPGDEVQVDAGWADPVGPIRRLRIYLTAPEERLGDKAKIATRFGRASSRRRVLVLDVSPERRHRLRATFTVPQVPSGRYRVGVCVNERNCFDYGRFRFTGSDFEEYAPKGLAVAGSPGDTLSRPQEADGSSSVMGAGVAAVVALALAALALRRSQHRTP